MLGTAQSVNATYHMVRNKSNIVILIDPEKEFDKIQHAFMIKNTHQARNRELSQLDKGHL